MRPDGVVDFPPPLDEHLLPANYCSPLESTKPFAGCAGRPIVICPPLVVTLAEFLYGSGAVEGGQVNRGSRCHHQAHPGQISPEHKDEAGHGSGAWKQSSNHHRPAPVPINPNGSCERPCKADHTSNGCVRWRGTCHGHPVRDSSRAVPATSTSGRSGSASSSKSGNTTRKLHSALCCGMLKPASNSRAWK